MLLSFILIVQQGDHARVRTHDTNVGYVRYPNDKPVYTLAPLVDKDQFVLAPGRIRGRCSNGVSGLIGPAAHDGITDEAALR